MDEFGSELDGGRVMAILRGMSAERTVELARIAWDLGISCVEVPVQSPAAASALAAVVRDSAGRDVCIGAGTVTSAQRLQWAIQAGARFTVAPGFDVDVAEESRKAGLAHLPGVASASEVQRALGAGFCWLKGFPATQLTPAWFSAMHGPFPEAFFVATGGIDEGNAAAFLSAGCRAVAIGSALERPEALGAVAALARN